MVLGVEAEPREVLVGGRQANGSVEVSVRELNRQMRGIRYQLELISRQLGQTTT